MTALVESMDFLLHRTVRVQVQPHACVLKKFNVAVTTTRARQLHDASNGKKPRTVTEHRFDRVTRVGLSGAAHP